MFICYYQENNMYKTVLYVYINCIGICILGRYIKKEFHNQHIPKTMIASQLDTWHFHGT